MASKDFRTDEQKKQDEFLSEPVLRLPVYSCDDAVSEPQTNTAPKELKVICKACKTEFPPLFADIDDCANDHQASGCAAMLNVSKTTPPFMYVNGCYGSRFDSLADSHGWRVREEKKSDEMQPGGPYCDKCIKRWINEGRLYRKELSPICSGDCKQAMKSYDEYRKFITISLRRVDYGGYPAQRIDNNMPIYYAHSTIYQIDEKDADAYKAHWKENEQKGLSTSVWICRSCFEKKTKIPVMAAKCALCEKKYRVDSTDTTFGENCCYQIGLSQCGSLWGKSKWKRGDGELRLSEDLTIKEAKKLCGDPVCDDCIQKMVDAGKLIYSGSLSEEADKEVDRDQDESDEDTCN